ncbi:MAG: hypothetical protein K8W52_32675 [Deltaproteobacteria bacterium]|nr:hypothetical protein [Deltaproteobacteria bacterium]
MRRTSIGLRRGTIVALLGLALEVPARADLPPELASACGDAVKGARAARVVGRTQGETIYLVTAKAGARLYSVTGGNEDPCGLPPVCTAFDARALATARGKLQASGAAASAQVVAAQACREDACPRLLVVQTGSGLRNVAGAIRVPDGCEPRLRTLALDRRHDAVHLMCSTSAGAGDIQAHLVYRVADALLVNLLSFDGGSTQLVSPSERADGACTIGPVGAIAITKIDGAPAWRVTRAPDAGQSGASCKQQRAIEEDLRWDAKAGAFDPIGAPRPLERDTCDCRR